MQFEDQAVKNTLGDLLDSLAVLDRDSDYYLATENIIKAKFDRLINIIYCLYKAGMSLERVLLEFRTVYDSEVDQARNELWHVASVAAAEIENHMENKDKTFLDRLTEWEDEVGSIGIGSKKNA